MITVAAGPIGRLRRTKISFSSEMQVFDSCGERDLKVAARRHEEVLGVRLEAVADEIEHRRQVGPRRDRALDLRHLGLHLGDRRVVQGRDLEAEALQARLEVAEALQRRRQVLLARVVRGVADEQRMAGAARLRARRPGRHRAGGQRRLQQAAPAQRDAVGAATCHS